MVQQQIFLGYLIRQQKNTISFSKDSFSKGHSKVYSTTPTFKPSHGKFMSTSKSLDGFTTTISRPKGSTENIVFSTQTFSTFLSSALMSETHAQSVDTTPVDKSSTLANTGWSTVLAASTTMKTSSSEIPSPSYSITIDTSTAACSDFTTPEASSAVSSSLSSVDLTDPISTMQSLSTVSSKEPQTGKRSSPDSTQYQTQPVFSSLSTPAPDDFTTSEIRPIISSLATSTPVSSATYSDSTQSEIQLSTAAMPSTTTAVEFLTTLTSDLIATRSTTETTTAEVETVDSTISTVSDIPSTTTNFGSTKGALMITVKWDSLAVVSNRGFCSRSANKQNHPNLIEV